MLVLGQHHDKTIDTSFDYQKTRHWIPFYSRKLTAERLVSETITGYWYVDDVIHSNSRIKMDNAIIEFREPGALIVSAIDGKDSVNIISCSMLSPRLNVNAELSLINLVDCKLIDPQIKMTGDGRLLMNRCNVSGVYDTNEKITALSFSVSVKISNTTLS